MSNKYIFNFQADLSQLDIPDKLNNPFGSRVPEIARLAAKEFQSFLTSASQEWEQDLLDRKGKMFGVLVVQKEDNSYSYLGAVSGHPPRNIRRISRYTPSVFDDSIDDYFINRGMTEITVLTKKIRTTTSKAEAEILSEERSIKSHALQQRLFENYQFLSISGNEKNVLEVFAQSKQGHPPAASGECAAPKLLQYALKNQLKPIAIAEFWWGNIPDKKDRVHNEFYPSCKSRCRPILEFMLDDHTLFDQAGTLG